MTHFAFVTQPLRGHLDPLNVLGQELVARGHRVSVFLEPEAAGMVGSGLGFEPVPIARRTATTPAASAGGAIATVPATGGRWRSILDMAWRTHHLCGQLPDAFRRAGIEAVIADQTEAAGALVARHLHLPHASIACALPLNREDGVPPPFVDWPFETGERARWRNRGGYRICDLMMTPVSAVIRRQARRLGLQGIRRLEDCFSPTLQLFQIVRALDFPRQELPATAHHVGPLRSGRMDVSAVPDDGRPIAFCSLGTLQGGRADLFARFARVVQEAGCRPIIAHGGRLSPEQIRMLPGAPLVFDFVPQRAVLARAAFALVHGGLNTVLDALAAGVPLVVVPLAHEQGAIAARIAASGAGVMVKPREIARELAPAVARVLREPSFRRQARQLAQAMASAGGVSRAADLIESALCGAPAAAPRGPRAAGEGSELASARHVETVTSHALRP